MFKISNLPKFRDIVFLLGIATADYGVFIIYKPAAIILAGVALIYLAMSYNEPTKEGDK